MKKIISIVIAVCFIVSFTSLGYAQNAPAKLGRGILNTLTGFWEVPLKMIRISKVEGMPMGLTIGLLKGLGWGVYRTGVGIYEILTFAIPAPAGYESIMDPATLFTSETMAGDPSMRSDFRPLSDQLSGGSTTRRSRSNK
ncbi:MAG: exosortase system-associated protein, TIGR04073 family [Candidatus Omnitrophota bacterium]